MQLSAASAWKDQPHPYIPCFHVALSWLGFRPCPVSDARQVATCRTKLLPIRNICAYCEYGSRSQWLWCS